LASCAGGRTGLRSLQLRGAGLGERDDLGEREVEAGGELEQDGVGWVPLTALDGADVVLVELGAGAELVLGEAPTGAEFTDGVTERIVSAAVRRRRHRTGRGPAGARELSKAMTAKRVLDLPCAVVERAERRGDFEPERPDVLLDREPGDGRVTDVLGGGDAVIRAPLPDARP
jgi:hypothetical protein